MSQYQTLYITIDTGEAARKLVRTLVEEELVACANIIDGATSMYRWNGEIKEDYETIIFAKTSLPMVQHTIERVKELHPYETPGIISMPIKAGNDDYLEWIYATTV